jgi:hypothetical protein
MCKVRTFILVFMCEGLSLMIRDNNVRYYQGDRRGPLSGVGFRAGFGGFGLASFLSVSGRGPLFSSRKRHFQKCQVWYNPEV